MVKKVTRNLPDEPNPSEIHLYSVNDPIPVPEAIELDSETAWALWEESLLAQRSSPAADIQNTRPATLPSSP